MTPPGARPSITPAGLRFGFALPAPDLHAGPPVLAGAEVEDIFPPAEPLGTTSGTQFFRAGPWRLGLGSCELRGDLEAATRQLYAELFAATRGHFLARIWNYMPAINADNPGGLENYRAFCRGRSLAFEAEFGADFRRHASAASAVGCDSGALTVVFAAVARAPRHLENPLQVPAYHYPPTYGPRPPTFARATVVADGAQRHVFVSGTSAIRGHVTIAPHDTAAQLDCTLENLREISGACGLGSDLARTRPGRRHVKVYLRHAADLPRVAERLEAALLRTDDTVSYLRADICRRELNIEIEVTLTALPAA